MFVCSCLHCAPIYAHLQAEIVKIFFFKRKYANLRAVKCIMSYMGRKKNEVSDFNRQISRAIRSGMGIRRLSGRALSRQINKSETYVRARVKDEIEWTLSDIESICDAWGITPEELLKQG